MKIAYGDLIGGLSGDMFVAALLDVGLPLRVLDVELRKIPTLDFKLQSSRKIVGAICARQFRVAVSAKDPRRSWKHIRVMIERSRLAPETKATGLRIFRRLAEAESKIHSVPTDKVHFHEVGATDSIVDIMGAAIGVRELGIDSFHFSPVPLGRSVARSMHGALPVPAPATMELLKGRPVYGVNIESETVTPTGAAIMRALGKEFGAQPAMIVDNIGYGAGDKEFPERPNLFRIVLGTGNASAQSEEMVVIETNIDDMNPQHYDHVMDRLFEAGARDVFLASIQMKKNRPGTLLTVICEPLRRSDIEEVLFRETPTIGVRAYPVSRTVLRRESNKVKTRFGEVTVKIVEQPDGTKRAAPEYDDLKRIAGLKKIPLKQLHDELIRLLDPQISGSIRRQSRPGSRSNRVSQRQKNSP